MPMQITLEYEWLEQHIAHERRETAQHVGVVFQAIADCLYLFPISNLQCTLLPARQLASFEANVEAGLHHEHLESNPCLKHPSRLPPYPFSAALSGLVRLIERV
jgi:hypothetical protein